MKFSALDVYFFQHHDTSQFHNPYQVQEPFEQICWHLTGLNQEQAGKVYANLKGKEREWKEKRLEQYVELLKMPGRPRGDGGRISVAEVMSKGGQAGLLDRSWLVYEPAIY